MNEEIKINTIDVQKINLKSNDVLLVTIKDDDVDIESLSELSKQFKFIFPNNKVAFMCVGKDDDIKFSIVSDENVGYCSGCDCGKKEKLEGNI